MSVPNPITLTLDRRLLEHPSALHVHRMRSGLWLYLDLLARLPAGTGSIEVEPQAVAQEMGLPEGTIRSWLGHLRKHRYLEVKRLNGKVRVSLPDAAGAVPEAPEQAAPPRFFTSAKLSRALGEEGNAEALQAALNLHSDEAIKRALAGALAVPENRIRRSRTALFLYLLKHNTHET
jgi:hypothetical protein